MKKVFLLLPLFFIVLGCKQAEYNYSISIINNSNYNITYNFLGTPQVLTSGDEKDHGEAHYTSITNIEAYDTSNARVSNVRIDVSRRFYDNDSTLIYTIKDADKYKLIIDNNLFFDVIIKAEEYIYDNNSDLDEVTITALSTVDITDDVFIYTNKPVFKIIEPEEPPYTINIEWRFLEIKDDIAGTEGIVHVTLK